MVCFDPSSPVKAGVVYIWAGPSSGQSLPQPEWFNVGSANFRRQQLRNSKSPHQRKQTCIELHEKNALAKRNSLPKVELKTKSVVDMTW